MLTVMVSPAFASKFNPDTENPPLELELAPTVTVVVAQFPVL